MAQPIVLLATSVNYPTGEGLIGQYYLAYTSDEACRAALHYLGRPYDPSYRLLLRDQSGRERWLRKSQTLAEQGVTAGMGIFPLIPKRAPAPVPAPISAPPPPPPAPPRFYCPFPNTYADRVAVPRPGADLAPHYVDLREYTRIAKIGAGSFGAVYSAKHNRTGAMVAIKELFPDPDNPTQQQSFTREVQLLATLRHPAILPLHGCTPFASEKCTILTPLMKSSLEQESEAERRGSPNAPWTATRKHIALLGVASAMHFMHDNRFIHRDLKAANVLLDEAGEPRVADFGLSKFVERGATLQQTLHAGTPQYMAPEILFGEDFDFRADVYAFGILMFIVLSGLEPFSDARNQVQLARRVTSGERPKIPAHVKKPYAELMAQCWDMAPEQRPAFADVVRALGEERFLEGLDLDAVKEYQARACPSDLVPETSNEFAAAAKRG